MSPAELTALHDLVTGVPEGVAVLVEAVVQHRLLQEREVLLRACCAVVSDYELHEGPSNMTILMLRAALVKARSP